MPSTSGIVAHLETGEENVVIPGRRELNARSYDEHGRQVVQITTFRTKLSRLFLWIGVAAPFAYSQPQTLQSLSSATGLTNLEVARGVIPILCLIVARLIQPGSRRKVRIPGRFLSLFLAVALLSTFWSISPKQSGLKSIVLIVGYLCLWGLVRRYEDYESALHGLANTVHVLLIAVAVEAVVWHHAAFNASLPGRLAGLYPSIAPDVLGTLAVVGLLANISNLVPAFLNTPTRRVALSAIYIAELIATGARSALIFGVVVVGLFLIIRRPWSSIRLVGLILMILLAGIGLASSQSKFDRYIQRGESSYTFSTLNGRTSYWSEAISAWSTARVEGLGYYSGHRFGLVLRRGQPPTENIDSTWIESLVDVGIVGAIPLFGFAITGMALIWKSRFSISRSAYLWAIATCFIYLFTSFINPTLQSNNTVNFIIWGFVLLAIPGTGTQPAGRDFSASPMPASKFSPAGSSEG
jgi:O-antigen ligase